MQPGHHQPARVIRHDLIESYPTTDPEDAEQPPALWDDLSESAEAPKPGKHRGASAVN